MTEAHYTYKCRLCGEIFYLGDSEFMRSPIMRDLIRFPQGATPPIEIHICYDGSYGIGDFCGVKKVEEK